MKSAPPTQINLRQFGWALIPALASWCCGNSASTWRGAG
jgi:hypothetical protein